MKVFNFIMQIKFGTVVFVCIYHISHKSEKIGKKYLPLVFCLTSTHFTNESLFLHFQE